MNASAARIACAAFGLLLVAAANPATAHASQHRAYLQDGSTMTYDASTDKYCLTQSVTGSNLPKRECLSQEDWAKAGLTIRGK